MQSIPKISPGRGRISLTSYGSNALLSELSSTYPLKLISPRTIHRNVAVVYSLSYGGGLVGGDSIDLSINVDINTVLVLRSQGSTKVFKSRPEQRLASVESVQRTLAPSVSSPNSSSPSTMQNMNAIIAAHGAIFLLPDPVTCFRSASYTQKQTLRLSQNASLVVIDWLTSGRSSMGEEWVFARYHSMNEIWVEGERIAKDVMLLDEPAINPSTNLPTRSMGDRLAPYSCYATVLLYGPLVQGVIESLASEYDRISVFKAKIPAEIIWSLSPLTSKGGAIVRVAGKETETVKRWLGQALGGIRDTVGNDVYRSAFLL